MSRISGFKPFILFFILIIAVVGGLIWYFSRPAPSQRISENNIVTPRPDVTYAAFTLQGNIVTVAPDKIVFDTMIPYNTSSGVVMQHTIRVALIDAGTQFVTASGAKTTLKSFKPGANIVVYYTSSPVEVSEQTASKIALK